MPIARSREAAGSSPGAGGRVVKLGRSESGVVGVSARDEDLAVLQEIGGLKDSIGIEISGGRPGAGRGVIQFGGIAAARVRYARRGKDSSVRQEGGAMIVATLCEAAGE